MRGDKSALMKDTPLCAPLTNQARSRTLQKIPTSQTNKDFPHDPAALQKRNKSSLSKRRGHGGSSGWVREVWRVGRPLRKGSPCASKVFLPFPSSTPAPLQTPSRGKWGSWGSECRVRRARGRRSTRQAPVNPLRGKALQPSEETEATGAGARQNPRGM